MIDGALTLEYKTANGRHLRRVFEPNPYNETWIMKLQQSTGDGWETIHMNELAAEPTIEDNR